MTPHASLTSTGWHPDYDGIAHRPYVESDNEGYVKGEEVWCVTAWPGVVPVRHMRCCCVPGGFQTAGPPRPGHRQGTRDLVIATL